MWKSNNFELIKSHNRFQTIFPKQSKPHLLLVLQLQLEVCPGANSILSFPTKKSRDSRAISHFIVALHASCHLQLSRVEQQRQHLNNRAIMVINKYMCTAIVKLSMQASIKHAAIAVNRYSDTDTSIPLDSCRYVPVYRYL